MERWNPLLEIFLKSSCPEGEAALWMQQQPGSPPFSAFLALLLRPCTSSALSPTDDPNRCMWIQTLPSAVQSRILSFLAIESHRFCYRRLGELAGRILRTNNGLDFWVERTALNVLRSVSVSTASFHKSVSDSVQGEVEFDCVPPWLQNVSTINSHLPWLPSHFRSDTVHVSPPKNGERVLTAEEHEEDFAGKDTNESTHPAGIQSEHDSALDPEIHRKATELKSQLLVPQSPPKIVSLAKDVRQLCLDAGGNAFTVLGLIEPWEAEDETIALLLPHLSGTGDELAWSVHVLCSVILPKFLILKEPASRVLSAATLAYCKNHQREAVDGLLFPLVFCKEGINTAVCDILTRVVKECLHSAHVSAFFQRFLCDGKEERKHFCLTSHQSLLSDKFVWTEALFSFCQNVLNHNVYLTEDSVGQIACTLKAVAERFSKSLKLGNFLLSLIGKCGCQVISHKLLFIEVAEKTDTFMTKSILSKLDAL